LKSIPENFGNLTKLKILRMYEREALDEFPVGVSKPVKGEVWHLRVGSREKPDSTFNTHFCIKESKPDFDNN
jgi:hypothetical protein